MTDTNKDKSGDNISLLHGVKDTVKGKIQEGVGKLTGNHELEKDGAATAAKGKVEVREAREEMRQKGELHEAQGKAKRLEGDRDDDLGKEISGAAEELAGKVRKAVNS